MVLYDRDFWKIDKIDKIVFSIILLFATFFSVFETFSFASSLETVSFETVPNLSISPSRNYFSTSSSGISVGFFELEKGYLYHIKNNNSEFSRFLVTSNEKPAVNVSYNFLYELLPGTSYDYLSNSDDKLFFDFGSSSSITVTRERVGYSGTISELVDSVGSENLWGVFEKSIPYISIIVIVSIGFLLFFTMVKGVSKGKGRI